MERWTYQGDLYHVCVALQWLSFWGMLDEEPRTIKGNCFIVLHKQALFCIEEDGILCYNKLKVNLLDSGCVCVCVWDLIWIRRRNLLYLCHRYSSIIQLNHLFSRNFLEMEFVIFIVRINVNNACKCLIDHHIHKFRGYFIIHWSLSYYRVTLTFSACMFKVIKTIITLMFVIVI